MKQFILLLGWSFFVLPLFAQKTEEADQLVGEGIELHDKGNYEEALKKYDAALKLDPHNFDANYEKTFTLFAMDRKKECVSLSKSMIKDFSDHPKLNMVYVQYGSALDDLGKTDDAVKVYEEGIKLFPDDYMLWFNEALTLMRVNRNAEAEKLLQQSLTLRPLHSSSNYYLGMLLESQNKIPSMLASLTFLAVEPQSERSKDGLARVKNLFGSNVKKEGNSTTIMLDPSTLGNKNDDKKENNFRTVELILSFSEALDQNKTVDSIASSPAAKLSLKTQLLIGSLDEGYKKGSGFYWKHYVPFFTAMKEAGYIDILCRLAYLKSGDDENTKWINDHEDDINKFYDWLKAYKWN